MLNQHNLINHNIHNETIHVFIGRKTAAINNHTQSSFTSKEGFQYLAIVITKSYYSWGGTVIIY